jgi:hypothetical protein
VGDKLKKERSVGDKKSSATFRMPIEKKFQAKQWKMADDFKFL